MKAFLVFALFFASVCFAGDLEQPNYACSLSGDPHFKSLDGINFDFQGIGWFDLIKHPHLIISAEFRSCGGKVSCMRNLMIWTDHCKTDACPKVSVTLNENKAYYQLDTTPVSAAHELTTTLYPTLRPLPVADMQVQWTGGTLTATGCVSRCALTWSVTAHTGYVVVVLNNPSKSLEVNWDGTYGICGTPNGNKEDEYSTSTGTSLTHATSSVTSWRNIIEEIKTWGLEMASDKDTASAPKVTAALVGATGSGSVGTGTAQATYSVADINAISTCVPTTWAPTAAFPGTAAVDQCTGPIRTTCLAEAADQSPAFQQCMVDFYNAYKSAATITDYNTASKGWTDERLIVASLYNSAIKVDESIMLGLFIGLGVGLVFVVAAVAFFAKNPELLPFTHKKKKVMKELAATDVLK